MAQAQHIVVFRTDRLGDVLMSLPALHYLSRALPHTRIDFVCDGRHHPVIAPLLKQWRIEVIAPERFQWSKLDGVLFLHAESKFYRMAWSRRIPKRIGPVTRWWSRIVLTRGIRQRRSLAEKSEALYNIDLAKAFLTAIGHPGGDEADQGIVLPENEQAKSKAVTALRAVGLKGKYWCLHPGMGGSALNVSADIYARLASKLLQTGVEVVATIGPAGRDQAIKARLLQGAPRVKVIEGVGIEVIAEIFRGAEGVIAPSTGPIHLAHLVSTKTFGIYSPVRTHRPSRWAPWGGQGRSVAIIPDVACPATVDCLGEKCPHFPCMEKFDWVKALEKIL